MRIMRLGAMLLVLLAAGVVLGPRPERVQAASGPIPFTALLNGGQEVPTNTSDRTGFAFVYYNPAVEMFCFAINHTVISPTAAHIHLGAIGVDGGPALTFDSVTSPMVSCEFPDAGFDDLLKAMKKGQTYINIHNATFPGGEIRGQLLPSSK